MGDATPRFVIPLRDLLRRLESDGRFAANIAALRRTPAAEARLAPWPEALHPRLRPAAEAMGIASLYSHQAAAVRAALDGRHVVNVAATASGKSLGYLLPILDRLLRDDGARALLVFPTKALARDQLARLAEWDEALGAGLSPAAYDGDTPQGARANIRRASRLIVTNPDMLHTAILPHHLSWAPFLAGLGDLVIDELHVYRGVWGSHVANVLRRLRRVCAFHGARPRFHFSSATIANPGELAAALAGGPVHVVDEDGAPRGPRSLMLYNPPLVDKQLGIRRSSLLEAESLARHFLAGGLQTLVFARSRQAAELILRYLAERRGDEDEGAPAPLLRGYRSGYTAAERREIEQGLRSGELRGVVATNALELGIDIGQLDVCIMAGYPGTIASTWQQAGRAGRRGGEALAILVASASPLDQFIVRHPRYLFERGVEAARIDPDNLVILLDHLRCAAFELPFDEAEAALPFGAVVDAAEDRAANSGGAAAAGDGAEGQGIPAFELLAVLEAEGLLRRVGGRWHWLAEAYPAAAVSLRGAGPLAVSIVRGAPGEAGPEGSPRREVLGTVDRASATWMVHPGAVYLHEGEAFRVRELDLEQGIASVEPADGATYTRASSRVDIQPLETLRERPVTGAVAAHGELELRSRVTSYRRLAFRSHEVLGWERLDMPEERHVAGGYWFCLGEAALESLRAIGRWQHDPLPDRGPDWARVSAEVRARDGQRCRLCNSPELPGRRHDVHHIRPYRQFAIGHGVAAIDHRAANDPDNLITLCPSCHHQAERALGLHGGLSGLGHALGHVAPLLLMCDARDLGVSAESHAAWSARPTVVVYEHAIGGLGFGEALYAEHERLLAMTRELIADCPCEAGCPACVGPVGEQDDKAKVHALAVLGALGQSGGEI